MDILEGLTIWPHIYLKPGVVSIHELWILYPATRKSKYRTATDNLTIIRKFDHLKWKYSGTNATYQNLSASPNTNN